MIRNRFSILMAERELTAAKVSAETGISRSTLSTLVNNSGDGVQFKTLDKLCNYLEVSPSDFFDYSPFILEYELGIPSYRKEVFSGLQEYKQHLIDLGNSVQRADNLSNEHLDIFGEARHEIEINATKGQKKFKYLMSIDVFPNTDIEGSNAPKNFDLVCLLNDQYGEKSFVNEVYNQVSITFQTQIRNECHKLVTESLADTIAFATVKNKDIKIFIQTPFGDSEVVVEPQPENFSIYQEKYGKPIIENW